MTTPSRTWLTAQAEHEGFPIYIRRPDVRVAEFEALRQRFPRLLIVKHMLTLVTENGLPEPDYNDSIEPLDAALTDPFEDETNGLIALIETFSGKRTYYTYIAPSFDANAYTNEGKARFPNEDIRHEVYNDPAWHLFKGYASDFQFT